MLMLIVFFVFISIHAPSRERHAGIFTGLLFENFNPRSLAGATKIPLYCCLLPLFQSTLPRGSDTCFVVKLTKIHQFQSTLPRGSDAKAAVIDCKRLISIHAPSRERHVDKINNFLDKRFQSTLPRGSDLTHS